MKSKMKDALWINAEKVLPEENTRVIVCTKTKKGVMNINIAYYSDGMWHGNGSMSGVIAWKPLPDFPESGDNKAEYIEREALIEFVKQNTPDINGETTIECVERAIRIYPVADVTEVRHGRWIEDHEFFKCSECGCLTDYRFSNFCPDCGAIMDGKVGADNA